MYAPLELPAASHVPASAAPIETGSISHGAWPTNSNRPLKNYFGCGFAQGYIPDGQFTILSLRRNSPLDSFV